VVGYCHLRRNLCSFRLDRVVTVETLPARFERPARFDPLACLHPVLSALRRLPRSVA
jgi:predicted DNA-binding transcriptional regulator YafY